MTGWVGRWNAALTVLGLLGCGSVEGEDAAQSPVDDKAPARFDAEGFDVTPEVAFPASASTTFGEGHRRCRERRSEITPELGTVLGFDVARDRTVLEATQVLPVLGSWLHDVLPTVVHYRGRIARVVRVDRRPPEAGWPVEEAVPVGCPSGVEYELIQQVYTEDGALRGAFLTRVPATQLDEPTARLLSAEVDMRNFSGELPVGWMEKNPGPQKIFATARVDWTVGATAARWFELSPTTWAGPAYDVCDWAFCREDGDLGIPMSYGIASQPSLESFDDLLGSFPIFTPRTLSEYSALAESYAPHVRIWITANAANSSDPSSENRVQVTASADGQVLTQGALDLAENERLSGGIVSGFIDIGPLPEGTTLDLQVQDGFGLGAIRSHVIVDECDVNEATGMCSEPGCQTQTSFVVVMASCKGLVNVSER